MKNSDKNMLLVVVVAFVAIMTLGGLGNAAYSINSFYWVPFIIDAGIFILTGIREWRKIGKEDE